MFPDFKQTLGKWGPSCATVSSALEGSAKWCERLNPPQHAKSLRAANTRLNKLWDSTFANLTPEVRKMLFQPLEGETIQQLPTPMSISMADELTTTAGIIYANIFAGRPLRPRTSSLARSSRGARDSGRRSGPRYTTKLAGSRRTEGATSAAGRSCGYVAPHKSRQPSRRLLAPHRILLPM